MAFANINTWFHATQEGREDEFHAAFEAAYAKLHASLGQDHSNYIGGEEVKGKSRFTSHSPWDTELAIGHFTDTTAEEVLPAIKAARAAYPGWQRTPFQERAQLLDSVADVMTKRFYELCAVMTIENGKTRFEASIDVDEGIDFCRSYAKQIRDNEGFVTQMGVPFPGENCTSRMRPYGVFAIIAPFNFPIAITMGMAVGAIGTGNTVIVKPAEQTPLCGELVASCLREAGVPTGVFNLVQGDEKAGKALVDSDEVDGFVFTGSKAVGMHVMVEANRTRPRPVIAEMGGKNPIIVASSADVEKAVDGVYNAAFGFTGQKCSACSRVYVHESLAEKFREGLVAKIGKTVIGLPAERGTYLGPVVEEATVKRFEQAVADAKKDGRVLTGGGRLDQGAFRKGYFLEPTFVDSLPDGHDLFRRELFAPFVAMATFTDFDAVLAEANATEYGLTAGVFAEDEKEIERFFDGIEAGVIYANRRRGGSTGAVVDGQVFVGWKCSGTTGRGAGGRNYLQQFLREQSVTRVTE